MGNTAFSRVLLKLSGEALAGSSEFGLNDETVQNIAQAVHECVELGVQVGVVVGGGNFWRGRQSGGMDRTRADHMGMLATVMNSLAFADALETLGVTVRVQTAIVMQEIAELFTRGRAVRHLEKGRVLVFGGGTGNPFFSTDTTAALRAAEIRAQIIFKASVIDGVYDSDPNINPAAKKFERISFTQILEHGLAVMDTTAASMCRDNGIPVQVFSLRDPQNIVRAVKGEAIGTIVKED